MTSESCCGANEWPQRVIQIVHTVAYTHQQPRACTSNTYIAVACVKKAVFCLVNASVALALSAHIPWVQFSVSC